MNILSYLLTLLIPVANNCYLDSNMIDARTNSNMKQAAIDLASREHISLSEAEQYFSCIPNNGYTYKRASQKQSNSSPLASFREAIVSPYRVKQGSKFFETNKETLIQVSEESGVNPYVITAIIGVESNYGNYTGKHNVKQALSTILAQLPKGETIEVGISTPNHTIDMIKVDRQAFFQNELVTLIQLERHFNLNTSDLNGSWDGGIGLPQFMPSSYAEYAASPTRTFPNLFDPTDAIYSVANYLTTRGMWRNGPIAQPVTTQDVEHITFNGNVYTLPSGHKIHRFRLPNGSYEYWQTNHNFDAIMTYNTRPHYALCIHQLAAQIHDDVNKHT